MKIISFFKVAILGIIIWVIIGLFGFLNSGIFSYPNDSPRGKYSLEVGTGENLGTLANKLKNDRVIASSELFSLVSKFNTTPAIKSGVYTLDLPATPQNILDQLNSQKPAPPNDTISVSLTEGDTAEDIAEKLEKSQVVSAKNFLSYIQDPANFDIGAYPFLPNPQSNCNYGEILKNCPKYYLEGYLFPDTYNFYKSSKPEIVVSKFLKNFEVKFWSNNKNKFNMDPDKARDELYAHLILSSVVEREVGRNYIKAMINESDLDIERSQVTQVYLNRVNKNMKWQADPTVWYGVDNKRGVGLDGNLNWGNTKYKTGYNTYQITGYPVGPIANPGLKTLIAALNPIASDNLFFVSDRSGKMYFGKSLEEHNKNIENVRKINQNLPSI